MVIITLDGRNRKVNIQIPEGVITTEERDVMNEILDNLFDIGWEEN